MASSEIDTTTDIVAIGHGRCLVRIPSTGRKFVVFSDGGALVYTYTDDDGANWATQVTVAAFDAAATAFYDSVNGRLNIVYAGGNNVSAGLAMRAITSNVASGTPGSLTTETVIASGGSNVGTYRPYAFHSATATNPRYWIIAGKSTALNTRETRVWLCAAGSSADTAGNWSTTNFTNLGGNSDSGASKCGVGVHWQVGGVDKVTLVFQEGSSDVAMETVTFDPTATTPTPGTVGTVTGSTEQNDSTVLSKGAMLAIAAYDDYLVVGCYEDTSGTWDFFKTVDGGTWSAPASWQGLSWGRAQIAKDGTNFQIVYTTPFGDVLNTDNPIECLQLTKATDTMEDPVAFSDTEGSIVNVPEVTPLGTVYAIYRGSTASPYTLRFDTLPYEGGGGGDQSRSANMLLLGVG